MLSAKLQNQHVSLDQYFGELFYSRDVNYVTVVILFLQI